MSQSVQPRVAVVGGGIAGLAAAFFLRGRGLAVTVLEGSPRLGGKLARCEVGGVIVDAGAEALLARRPEGIGLITELGLAGDLVEPATTAASIWTRGALRPLPARQFMGVPADLDELAASGILSAAGAARARRDLYLPATSRSGDVPVARQVGARFGPELVDRLVDPLLGGVYAGRADRLSFEATLPGLAAQSRQHRSLSAAAAALLPPPPGQAPPGQAPARPAPARPAPARPAPPGPVFTTLAGGLAALPPALAAACGADVRTGAMVRALARLPAPPGRPGRPGSPAAGGAGGGWRLTVGSAHAPERLDADAVILALPARPASRLLAEAAGAGQAGGAAGMGGAAGTPAAAAAAAGLAQIEYASMAVITLAYPAGAFGAGPAGAFGGGPGGSGYLVPAVDGRAVKAVTFCTVKWPHLRPGGTGPHIVRCSVGRIGEEALLHRDDGELAGLAAAELAAATGAPGRPADYRVTRWGGGLPQYTVGHLDRVARIRAAVAALPGLAVCGATFDGLGIPACIGTARLAADQVVAYLKRPRQ